MARDDATSAPVRDIELLPRDGRARLLRGWAAAQDFEALRQSVDWQQETIRMYGREIRVPRLVAYYGSGPYRYSGLSHPARPLPAALAALGERASLEADTTFDSVLANLYRDGADGMGWHRDDEAEIDPRCIASISFGASRRFRFRHRESRETVTVELDHGDLLLMIDCQAAWEHALTKTKRRVGPRINLTFRRLRSRTETSAPAR